MPSSQSQCIHARRPTAPRTLDNSDAEEIRLQFFYGETRLENRLLYELRSDACEESAVTRNTMSAAEKHEAIVQSTNSELGSCRYTPTAFASAEAFGGGSEYLLFGRLA